MMYSRPSGVNPPSPLKNVRSRRGAAGITRAGRYARTGASSGARAAPARALATCSASVPRLSLRTARATDCNRMRSSSRDLLRRPHEDSARTILHDAIRARRDQAHDLVVQDPAGSREWSSFQITRSTAQPLQSPVGLRLHQLAHQFDIAPYRRSAPARSADRRRWHNPTGRTGRAGSARSRPASARIAGLAYMTAPARRPYSCASASVALIWRSTTWLCVQARSNTRSARRRSRYFSTSSRLASRVSADAGHHIDA